MSSILAAYQAKKAALVDQDRSLRREYIRSAGLSAAEVKADQIVRSIRAEEASSIWDVEHPSVPHPFPGMEFLTGCNLIVKTKLFEILLKMPKGALLHSHIEAAIKIEILLKLALEHPAMHVRVNEPITASNVAVVLPEFKGLPQELFCDASSLTDNKYAPSSWISLRKARESFSPELGGPEGFDKWVTSSLTINPDEAYGTHNTITKL